MRVSRTFMLSKLVGCLAVAVVCLLTPTAAVACTIGIISGSVTTDGRPMLWKNRDVSGDVGNELRAFSDAEIVDGYIGIVSTDNEEETKVWSGVNDAGFAIMNSLVSISGYLATNNGVLMKTALMTCRTVDDFEALIASWSVGKLRGNFGVMDAYGGASLFEVKALEGELPEFIRTDAEDTETGIIVMANANTYGPTGSDIGEKRKARAGTIIGDAATDDTLSLRFMLRMVSKDIGGLSRGDITPDAEFDTNDFISRWRTRSATVVHGVRADKEDPRLTTFWTVLGEPVFGIAVPAFSFAHDVPNELTAEPGSMAPLNIAAQDAELVAYTDNTSDTTIRPYPLFYPEASRFSILQHNGFVEDEIRLATRAALFALRQSSRHITAERLAALQDTLASFAEDSFWR